RCAQNDCEICRRSLRHRHKCFIPCVWFSQAAGKGKVVNYADDFVNILWWTNTAYVFSDRTFVGPKGTGSRFIDDNDLRALGRIRCVEGTTLLQTSTECLEVVATYRFDKCFRQLLRRRLRSTFNQKRTGPVETKHQIRTANRNVLHSGQRA